MSITRQITVWCDECGNWEQIATALVRKAERLVVDHNQWTISYEGQQKRHFCAKCSAKIKEEK